MSNQAQTTLEGKEAEEETGAIIEEEVEIEVEEETEMDGEVMENDPTNPTLPTVAATATPGHLNKSNLNRIQKTS